jgi:hypothetical protein
VSHIEKRRLDDLPMPKLQLQKNPKPEGVIGTVVVMLFDHLID